jgi:aspartate 1-decarboxylase
VIVISYAEYEEAELENFEPRIVFVDERNQVVKPAIRRAQ